MSERNTCRTCKHFKKAVHGLWGFCYRWSKDGDSVGLRPAQHKIGCPFWKSREEAANA